MYAVYLYADVKLFKNIEDTLYWRIEIGKLVYVQSC